MKLSHPFLLLLLLLSFSNCKPSDVDCSTGNLQFDLPVQVIGLKDTLQIGDTLRIKLEIPDRMPERRSGIEYDFVDYEFMLSTTILRMDTSYVVPAPNHFDFEALIGEVSYINGSQFIKTSYKNHIYTFEAILIAKRKGLFVNSLISESTRHYPLKKLEGPCSKNVVYVYPKLALGIDNNYDFVKFSPSEPQANVDQQRFEEAAGFCFFVQ